MICPHCQGKTSVKDTREMENGLVRRRRVCRRGHITTTWESHLNPLTHLKARERNKRHVKNWWERLDEQERAEKRKRYRMRTQARKEAAVTGLPVEQILQQWGVA